MARTDASFAMSFVAATPTEAVRLSSSRTSRRILAPISGGGPNRSVAPETSRNASSSETGSATGETPSRTSRNRLEYAT